MKKLFFFAILFASYSSYSQGKTLVRVSIVKPKMAQWSAFETAWKAHVAKFHNTDRKINVHEVLSGENAGAYQLVEGPISYADMDKEWPNNSAHDQDFEKNVATKLEMDRGPFYYSHRDSLSYNSDIQSDKAQITISNVKNGRMGDYLQEIRRTALVAQNLKAPFGVNAYVQLFSGSEPQIVAIRSLKDGFKELEANYFKRPDTEFRDGYVKAYGQQGWDKRTALLRDDITSREVFLTKFRKDLSSK